GSSFAGRSLDRAPVQDGSSPPPPTDEVEYDDVGEPLPRPEVNIASLDVDGYSSAVHAGDDGTLSFVLRAANVLVYVLADEDGQPLQLAPGPDYRSSIEGWGRRAIAVKSDGTGLELSESTNGGVTWEPAPVPAGLGADYDGAVSCSSMGCILSDS